MAHKLAIVICVHHKPWLVMSTLVTIALQDYEDADVFIVFNKGNGERDLSGYDEYRMVAKKSGANIQLSAYDERVEEICVLNGRRVHYLEYENDHALDSGAWYKFIRDNLWRDYDYTLFVGEGMLLARPNLLSSLLAFAKRQGVDFITSGHEKRRIPKKDFINYNTRNKHPTHHDRFHDRMIREALDIFCRDPEFKTILDHWRSDYAAETQNHVPDLLSYTETAWKSRARIQQLSGPLYGQDGSVGRMLKGALRSVPGRIDALRSVARMRLHWCCGDVEEPSDPRVFVQGRHWPVSSVVQTEREDGVAYHRVEAPEWFGCAVSHFMSRSFLECLSDRLDRGQMYDVIDLPYAGTPLEVIWGFMPAWLGFEKWFTDGMHRVRKNFTTYQREDYPPEIASYINRYYCGRICVGWDGDYLKIRSLRRDYRDLVTILPERYF